MKIILAGSLIAIGLFAAVPASSQTLEIGPDGPSIDLWSRDQRDRYIDRGNVRRGEIYREQREIRRDRETDDDDDED